MTNKAIKILLKTLVVLFVFAAILVLFKGCIYQTAIKYEDAGGRKIYKVKDDKLEAYIIDNLPEGDITDIEEIVNLSLDITSKTLQFKLDSKEKDPKKLIPTGEVNCMGYASFNAAVGNYLINKYNLKDWKAKPVKGKLYLFGYEITSKSKESYFKDHDFVIFYNKNTKDEIYIDPSVHDCLGIDKVDKYVK